MGNMTRRKAMRDWLSRYKAERPCMDCGCHFPAVAMDFDHRDPNQKSMTIALAISSEVSWKRLQEEIAKCDLICANCHRVRTHT